MHKLNTLRSIDSYLFDHTIRRIEKIYLAGLELNRGRHYVYHFFRPNNPYVDTVPPSAALKEFLDSYRDEFSTSVLNRRLIMAYLTRFMNQCNQPSTITYLLPPTIAKQVFCAVITNHHDERLADRFKKSREYKLIQEQAVFNSMGL